VLAPSAVSEESSALTEDLVGSAAPARKVTTSLSASDTPPTVPVTVAIPVLVEEVRLVVYVPFPLSITADKVPRDVETVTVEPPVAILFPLISFNCIVMTVEVVPFAIMLEDAAVINEFAALGIPLETNATVSLSVIAVPPSVPVIVAVAVELVEVKVAV
jgi:hypothetical protein